MAPLILGFPQPPPRASTSPAPAHPNAAVPAQPHTIVQAGDKPKDFFTEFGLTVRAHVGGGSVFVDDLVDQAVMMPGLEVKGGVSATASVTSWLKLMGELDLGYFTTTQKAPYSFYLDQDQNSDQLPDAVNTEYGLDLLFLDLKFAPQFKIFGPLSAILEVGPSFLLTGNFEGILAERFQDYNNLHGGSAKLRKISPSVGIMGGARLQALLGNFPVGAEISVKKSDLPVEIENRESNKGIGALAVIGGVYAGYSFDLGSTSPSEENNGYLDSAALQEYDRLSPTYEKEIIAYPDRYFKTKPIVTYEEVPLNLTPLAIRAGVSGVTDPTQEEKALRALAKEWESKMEQTLQPLHDRSKKLLETANRSNNGQVKEKLDSIVNVVHYVALYLEQKRTNTALPLEGFVENLSLSQTEKDEILKILNFDKAVNEAVNSLKREDDPTGPTPPVPPPPGITILGPDTGKVSDMVFKESSYYFMSNTNAHTIRQAFVGSPSGKELTLVIVPFDDNSPTPKIAFFPDKTTKAGLFDIHMDSGNKKILVTYHLPDITPSRWIKKIGVIDSSKPNETLWFKEEEKKKKVKKKEREDEEIEQPILPSEEDARNNKATESQLEQPDLPTEDDAPKSSEKNKEKLEDNQSNPGMTPANPQ